MICMIIRHERAVGHYIRIKRNVSTFRDLVFLLCSMLVVKQTQLVYQDNDVSHNNDSDEGI